MELIDLANSFYLKWSNWWLTFLLGSLAVTRSIFFLLMLVYVLQCLSLHWNILVECCCLSFHWLPTNSKRNAPFHRIAYDYSRAEWGGLRDHWRISLNSVLLLLLLNFVSEFKLELMYVSLIASIRSNFTHLHGFQLAAYAAAIVQRNRFFRLYQQSKSSQQR